MRLLLDSHIFLALIEKQTGRFPQGIQQRLTDATNTLYLSIASLWEIAIKWRLGKLQITPDLDALPGLINGMGIELVPINEQHVLIAIDPEPDTRDPFDRLLLAQCRIEGLRLVTIDRALTGHPLAVRA